MTKYFGQGFNIKIRNFNRLDRKRMPEFMKLDFRKSIAL